MTGTRRPRSAASSARPARSSSPTRTCCTPRSCPTTRSGSSSSSSCATSSSTRRTPIAGVFGSHVANVLRRLLRLCAHYGSTPQIVCCSATIGNPGDARRDADRPAVPRHRPQRRAAGRAARRRPRPASARRAHRRPARAPRPRASGGAGLPARRAPDHRVRRVAGGRGAAAHVAARGAPRRPRPASSACAAIAAATCPPSGARSRPVCGPARCSASSRTNALELGIDIGRLDAAVLAGYPGTIAATWQQMGRAGRRGDVSVAILVAGAGAVDRFVASHPDYLFDSSPGGGPPRPGERPRPAGAPARGDLRAALRVRRDVRRRARRRPARLPRRGGPRPPRRRRALVLGQRELPGVGDQPAGPRRPRTCSSSTTVPIGRASSARSTCSPRARSSTRTRSTSTSRASTTSTGSTGTSARPTCARSTSTTTPRRSSP